MSTARVSDLLPLELASTRATLPIFSKVRDLFTDPKMFKSFGRFADEGFDLVDHSEHKMMSGSHKRAKGYLFKKYNNDKPGKDQLRNYMHRIEGSRMLRSFIAARGFTRVTSPRKWIYELPASFPERYLLIAEKMDLVDRADTENAYARISKQQTHELATVLYYFRGLNSWLANLPFTKDGQIAFIDTERWHYDKEFLRKVGDHLPSDRYAQAKKVFKVLDRRGERPFVSTFK